MKKKIRLAECHINKDTPEHYILISDIIAFDSIDEIIEYQKDLTSQATQKLEKTIAMPDVIQEITLAIIDQLTENIGPVKVNKHSLKLLHSIL